MSTAGDAGDGREDGGVLAWFPAGLPPAQKVIGLFAAKWAIGALRPLVLLGVPDLLAEGPRTAADLAREAGVDPDVLHRLLRAAAAVGVVREAQDGTYVLAPEGQGLRSGVPDGVREMFLFASDPVMWRPYEELPHTLRTGEPAFGRAFGTDFFAFLREHPATAALFDHAMVQNRYPGTDRVLDGFDFSRFPRIADVGGGRGHFLAAILARHPGCTGAVCDQPQVVAGAKEQFEQHGVADRATAVETDFFTSVPAGFDAYLIKHTLHNWNDRDAVRILSRVRDAIGTDLNARLLVVDALLTGPGGFDLGKLTDVEMLAVLDGRERDRADWDRITAAAGFAPAGEDPEPGDLVLLEFRPV
ncbi:methyltransferase [Streptomyces mashuensis]|uniref:Methyltransferase n=1 Tax=Streptomyces mashuensis TaxID=33904 RepID=A0A919EFG6_9ACTN|nr:methyltransferase [Streptomyces mashuensis]GHF65517.1 methyltransferase [Streptomyces mashuensis]